MRALVLGGCGFIGRHLVLALRERMSAVRVLDLALPAEENAVDDVEYLSGSFLEPETLKKAVDGVDICFHLAATTLPASANRDVHYDLESNVGGSLKLLDACRDADVKRVVFLSSGGTVYGVPRTIPVPEDHGLDPISAYGVSKVAIEKYLHLYYKLHGLDYRIVRLANPYGPGQSLNRSQGAIPIFLNRILNNEIIEIWGNGEVIRDFIYIDDVCTAILAVALGETEERVFNVGSGHGTSLNQLLTKLRLVCGLPGHVDYRPARAFDVPTSVLDISRIQYALGWSPQVSMEEGLRNTVEAVRRAKTAST